MTRKSTRLFSCALALWMLLSVLPAPAAESATRFAFVNPNYIITAELATRHKFVVNFINLSDFVIVVKPSDFIYRAASGSHYIGQVYELEHKDTRGETQKYSASVLIRAHSFTGLNVVGVFREQDRIEELSVRIGSRRHYLAPLGKNQFDQLARKVENLDLDGADAAAAFQEANIQEMGSVESTDGTADWDKDWEGLIASDGVNSPKAIESPPIPLPEGARRSDAGKKVKVSCLITTNGGILNLKVVKGIDRSLDQRVLDGIMNSWVFLPATKNGEVYESVIEFEVGFAQPDQSP